MPLLLIQTIGTGGKEKNAQAGIILLIGLILNVDFYIYIFYFFFIFA